MLLAAKKEILHSAPNSQHLAQPPNHQTAAQGAAQGAAQSAAESGVAPATLTHAKRQAYTVKHIQKDPTRMPTRNTSPRSKSSPTASRRRREGLMISHSQVTLGAHGSLQSSGFAPNAASRYVNARNATQISNPAISIPVASSPVVSRGLSAFVSVLFMGCSIA